MGERDAIPSSRSRSSPRALEPLLDRRRIAGVRRLVALQFQADRIGPLEHVPPDLLVMVPYVVTILAVVLARASRYPPAVGVRYRPSAKAS
jgi:hypothetical protein